jgi:hypothetical protein
VEKIRELIGALSDEELIARSFIARRDRTCRIYGQPAEWFRTPFSELEYSLSSICQACRDYYFLHDEFMDCVP